ncbi:MAG: hypothetical protein JW867_01085, partial [Candidatus Omnitrophica bacterium]|nr:hypothetical protein [Candidatus Omnitrophota bacterium]
MFFPVVAAMSALVDESSKLAENDDISLFLSQRSDANKERIKRVKDEQLNQDSFVQKLVLGLWHMVAKRDKFYTLIAGYPWFSDWGRDTFISFGGVLEAGMFDIAKGLIIAFGKFEDRGMLPNIVTGEQAGNYDTVDAPLLYVLAVRDYIETTKDKTILNEVVGERTVAQVLESIVTGYMQGTPNGIKMDRDSKLVYSPAHFTWMDTNFPAATARAGYTVENNARWYEVLLFVSGILSKSGKMQSAQELNSTAQEVKDNFVKYFWIDEQGGYLADVLVTRESQAAKDACQDKAIRPNQVIAVLSADLLNQEQQIKVVTIVEQKLLTPVGLRTLSQETKSQDEFPFRGHYEGPENDSMNWPNRKLAYHNGTVWPHLFGDWALAFVVAQRYSKASLEHIISYFYPFIEHLEEAGIGSISEVLDANYPHWPRGCSDQAWAVAKTLEAYVKIRKAYKAYEDNLAENSRLITVYFFMMSLLLIFVLTAVFYTQRSEDSAYSELIESVQIVLYFRNNPRNTDIGRELSDYLSVAGGFRRASPPVFNTLFRLVGATCTPGVQFGFAQADGSSFGGFRKDKHKKKQYKIKEGDVLVSNNGIEITVREILGNLVILVISKDKDDPQVCHVHKRKHPTNIPYALKAQVETSKKKTFLTIWAPSSISFKLKDRHFEEYSDSQSLEIAALLSIFAISLLSSVLSRKEIKGLAKITVDKNKGLLEACDDTVMILAESDPSRSKLGYEPNLEYTLSDIALANQGLNSLDRQYLNKAIDFILKLKLVRGDPDIIAVLKSLQQPDAISIRAGPFNYIWGSYHQGALYLDQSLFNDPANYIDLLLTIIHEAGAMLGRQHYDNERFAFRALISDQFAGFFKNKLINQQITPFTQKTEILYPFTFSQLNDKQKLQVVMALFRWSGQVEPVLQTLNVLKTAVPRGDPEHHLWSLVDDESSVVMHKREPYYWADALSKGQAIGPDSPRLKNLPAELRKGMEIFLAAKVSQGNIQSVESVILALINQETKETEVKVWTNSAPNNLSSIWFKYHYRQRLGQAVRIFGVGRILMDWLIYDQQKSGRKVSLNIGGRIALKSMGFPEEKTSYSEILEYSRLEIKSAHRKSSMITTDILVGRALSGDYTANSLLYELISEQPEVIFWRNSCFSLPYPDENQQLEDSSYSLSSADILGVIALTGLSLWLVIHLINKTRADKTGKIDDVNVAGPVRLLLLGLFLTGLGFVAARYVFFEPLRYFIYGVLAFIFISFILFNTELINDPSQGASFQPEQKLRVKIRPPARTRKQRQVVQEKRIDAMSLVRPTIWFVLAVLRGAMRLLVSLISLPLVLWQKHQEKKASLGQKILKSKAALADKIKALAKRFPADPDSLKQEIDRLLEKEQDFAKDSDILELSELLIKEAGALREELFSVLRVEFSKLESVLERELVQGRLTDINEVARRTRRLVPAQIRGDSSVGETLSEFWEKWQAKVITQLQQKSKEDKAKISFLKHMRKVEKAISEAQGIIKGLSRLTGAAIRILDGAQQTVESFDQQISAAQEAENKISDIKGLLSAFEPYIIEVEAELTECKKYSPDMADKENAQEVISEKEKQKSLLNRKKQDLEIKAASITKRSQAMISAAEQAKIIKAEQDALLAKRQEFDVLASRLNTALAKGLREKRQGLVELSQRLEAARARIVQDEQAQLAQKKYRLDDLGQRLEAALVAEREKIAQRRLRLEELKECLDVYGQFLEEQLLTKTEEILSAVKPEDYHSQEELTAAVWAQIETVASLDTIAGFSDVLGLIEISLADLISRITPLAFAVEPSTASDDLLSEYKDLDPETKEAKAIEIIEIAEDVTGEMGSTAECDALLADFDSHINALGAAGLNRRVRRRIGRFRSALEIKRSILARAGEKKTDSNSDNSYLLTAVIVILILGLGLYVLKRDKINRFKIELIINKALNSDPDHVVYNEPSQIVRLVRQFFRSSAKRRELFERINSCLEKLEIEVHVFTSLPAKGYWQLDLQNSRRLIIFVRNQGNLGSVIVHEISAAISAVFPDPSRGTISPISHEVNQTIEIDYHNFSIKALGVTKYDQDHDYTQKEIDEIKGINKGKVDFSGGEEKSRLSKLTPIFLVHPQILHLEAYKEFLPLFATKVVLYNDIYPIPKALEESVDFTSRQYSIKGEFDPQELISANSAVFIGGQVNRCLFTAIRVFALSVFVKSDLAEALLYPNLIWHRSFIEESLLDQLNRIEDSGFAEAMLALFGNSIKQSYFEHDRLTSDIRVRIIYGSNEAVLHEGSSKKALDIKIQLENFDEGKNSIKDSNAVSFISFLLVLAQIPFIIWIFKNKKRRDSIPENQRGILSFVRMNSWFTLAVIFSAFIVLSTLWSSGLASLHFNYELLVTIVTLAIVTTIGDTWGRYLANGQHYKPWLIASRFLTVFLIIGPLLGINCAFMVSGVNNYFPQTEYIFTFTNLVRGWVMFSSGAIITSILYSMPVPGLFEKIAVNSNYRNNDFSVTKEDVEKVYADYSLKKQLLKTLEGVSNRWLVVIPNFIYMNVLPWMAVFFFGIVSGHLFIRVVSAGLVGTAVRTYVSWKSGKPDLGGNFKEIVYNILRWILRNNKKNKLQQPKGPGMAVGCLSFAAILILAGIERGNTPLILITIFLTVIFTFLSLLPEPKLSIRIPTGLEHLEIKNISEQLSRFKEKSTALDDDEVENSLSYIFYIFIGVV